jgi:hypothetical protein
MGVRVGITETTSDLVTMSKKDGGGSGALPVT